MPRRAETPTCSRRGLKKLLVARRLSAEPPSQGVRQRAVPRVDVRLGLAVEPMAERVEDLPIVAGDDREVFLAHLRDEGVRVLGDGVHELRRLPVDRPVRCPLQSRDRELPRSHRSGHVRALAAYTLVTDAEGGQLRRDERQLRVRKHWRRAGLRSRDEAVDALFTAAVGLPQEAPRRALLLSESPVGALVDLRAGARADALVCGPELVGVPAIVLPAALRAKGGRVNEDPVGAAVTQHDALLYAIRVAAC
mmetsp:Transcript_87157/g.244530  ORF Transcript_87157/g.244530 Transcript_87157/m.244530 type:complete len:251 (-) Transcript_87157:135-887(-)